MGPAGAACAARRGARPAGPEHAAAPFDPRLRGADPEGPAAQPERRDRAGPRHRARRRARGHRRDLGRRSAATVGRVRSAPARDGRSARRRARGLLARGARRRLASAAGGARGRDARPRPRARRLGARGRPRGSASERALAPPGDRARQGQGSGDASRGAPARAHPARVRARRAHGRVRGRASGGARLPGAGHRRAVDRRGRRLRRTPRAPARPRSRGGPARARPAGDDDRPRPPAELRPSTVSAHLDVLARAGLVERHRVRRSVFYGLNDTGRAFVALLADIPEVLSA